MIRYSTVIKYPRGEYAVDGLANAVIVWRSFGEGGAPPAPTIPRFRHHYVMQRAA